MNLLAIFNKPRGQQELKQRILKNKEVMLDIMSRDIEGAKNCPFLLGQKCIGRLCEMFMEFKNYNDMTKEEFVFWRCAFVQTPLLIIELNRNILTLKSK